MSKWQPLEAAPRGEWVLITTDALTGEAWKAADGWRWSKSCDLVEGIVTGWMPLPKPRKRTRKVVNAPIATVPVWRQTYDDGSARADLRVTAKFPNDADPEKYEWVLRKRR